MADFFSRLRGNKTEDIEPLMAQGRAHLSARDYSAALADFDEVLKLAPGHAPALSRKSEALYQLGQLEEALDAADQAIKADPEVAATWLARARPLYDLRRLEEAIESCDKAIQLFPALAEAYAFKGSVLMISSGPEKAKVAFDRALEIEPDNPDNHFNLANALERLGRHEDARREYETVVRLSPEDAAAYNNLGNVLAGQNRLDEASTAFGNAVKANPAYIDAYLNESIMLEQSNQLERARAVLETALEKNPADPRVVMQAAILDRRAGDFESARERLDRVEPDRIKSLTHQAEYYFERGRVFDRLNRMDEAFASFKQGNRVNLSSELAQRFDKKTYLQVIDNYQSVFKSEWLETWSPGPEDPGTDAPVFLIGFPRSGTTLLDQMLGGHKQIRVLEEASPIQGIAGNLCRTPKMAYPDILSKLTAADVKQLRKNYFIRVERMIGSLEKGEVVVDKLPLNVVDIGLIYRLFPEANYIFAIRHPCDVVLSCFMQRFKPNNAMIHLGSVEDAAALYDRVMSLFDHYRNLLDLHVTYVRYEDLVVDPEPVIRKVTGFLGLEWDENVLHYRDTARRQGVINTPSYAAVSEELYQHAKFRWKRYQSRMENVLPVLVPWTDYWGYTD